MATQEITYRVCDTCGDEIRLAETYRITPPGSRSRTREVDLCDEHSLPVRKALNPKATAGIVRLRADFVEAS
ncbi:hypothetical protein FHE66_11010 [Georgenia sp. 311]|uniref:hypothetical protein n=1 Tax=Georgenia sp. 311 TaxID=2585134 RepID=UPI001111CA2E|nr:hypothetical protein [Georgenia sp. 311]TNC17203.1 hypothetical protein FHE66_11010 [Georgenia sp. 311]